jgi:hypothetical protein
LPGSVVIASLRKIVDLISISCPGICGEEDFRCQRLKKTRLPGKREESIRSKRVDMLWIWDVYSFGDKLEGIAEQIA